MIAFLYERVTGQRWKTTRSMAAEFGPTPATRYPELAVYSDAELLADGERILAEAAGIRADVATVLAPAGVSALAHTGSPSGTGPR